MEQFKQNVVAFIEAESKGWMDAADRANGTLSTVLRGKACAVFDIAKQVAAMPVDERTALMLKRAEEYRVAFDDLVCVRAEAARVQDGYGASMAALSAFDAAERALHKAALGAS